MYIYVVVIKHCEVLLKNVLTSFVYYMKLYLSLLFETHADMTEKKCIEICSNLKIKCIFPYEIPTFGNYECNEVLHRNKRRLYTYKLTII